MENNTDQLHQHRGSNFKKKFLWFILLAILLVSVGWYIASGNLKHFFQKDNQDQALNEKIEKIKAELRSEQLDYIDGKFEDMTGIIAELMKNSHETSVAPELLVSTTNTHLETSSENLIRNSSFEFGSNGHPRQWNYILESTDSNTNQSLESIRSGKYGLKFSGGSGSQLGISQPITKTVPGRNYTLSLYVKSVNVAPGTVLRLGFWNEYNNKYAFTEEVTLSSTKDWDRVSTIISTSGQITDGANWYPIIEVKNHTSGAVYIDDVLLTEGKTLITYSSATAGEQVSSLIGNGSVLISSTGTIYPAEDGIGSIGTINNRWQDLFLKNATINENGDMNLAGDLNVGQDLIVNGNSTFKGDMTFGETTDDTITFNGTSSFPGGITVGENNEFVINNSGNITKINGVDYSYPSMQGAATSVLINDGAGNLSWGTFGAASVTADSLDFAQFVDSMTVDSNTLVNLYNGGNVDLRFYNSNSSSEILFLEGSTGRVGIGNTDPQFTLDVNGSINALTLNIAGSQITSSAAELNYVDGASVTNGGIVFGNGTNFTQDSANLFWENTTNRLGIGTTNPSVSLEVNGDIKLLNGFDYYFGNIGLNDTGTSRTTSGASKVGTFDEFLNSSSLTVQDVLDDLDATITSFAAGSGDIEAVGSMTAGAVFADTDSDDQWLGLGMAAGRIEFDNEAINEVNILDAYVGIGTTTPGYTLDVVGNIRAGTDVYIGSIALGSTAGATVIGVNSAGFVGATGAATVQSAIANLDFLIGNRDYTNNANHILSSDGGSITSALDLINVQIGNRDYTNSLLLTDGETITSSLNVLNVAVGSTSYSSTNYVTPGSSISVAIAALDSSLAAISSGTSVSWTDAGVYLYPTGGEVLGNGALGGPNKLSGLFLADNASVVYGTDNDFRTLFNGTNFILGNTANTFLSIGESGTTGNFNFNRNQFYIRGDGNVGIGTTAPVTALDVVGTVSATDFSCSDCLDAGNIATGAVGTLEIADGTVSSTDILDSTILTGDIGLDTILAADIAAGAVGTSEIADGTVSSTDILDNTIAAGDIAPDAITASELAADSVGDSELFNGGTWTLTSALNITGADVGLGIAPVVKLDIDTGSNTDGLRLRGLAETVEIANMYVAAAGSLVLSTTGGSGATSFIDIRPEDNDYGLILRESDGTGSTAFSNFYVVDATTDVLTMNVSSITDQDGLSITSGNNVGIGTSNPSAKLDVIGTVEATDFSCTDCLEAANIATGAIGTLELADGTVSSTDILDSTILTGDIGLDTLLAADIAAGAIGTSEIADNTIAAADIAANAITASELAADSVGDSELFNGGTWNLTSGLSLIGGNLGVGGTSTTQARIKGYTTVAQGIGVEGISSSNYGVLGRSTTGLGMGAYGEEGIDIIASGGFGISVISTGGTTIAAARIGASSLVASFGNSSATCTVIPGGTGFLCSSDASLKKDITNVENGLSKVMGLRAVNFRWNTDTLADSPELGFIAQEVEKIVPELIYKDPETGLRSMGYGNLTPLLVSAVQEQQDMINNNKKGLSNLSNSYDQLFLADNLFTSKVDSLAMDLNEINHSIETNTDILGIQSDVSTLEENLIVQKNELSVLQTQMNEVFDIIHKSDEVASEEADLTALTDRVSLLEQLVMGAKEVSAATTETASDEAKLEDTTVLEDLTVTGKTNVFDLGIVGDMSIGQIVVRGMEATINSLTEPIKIQSEASSPVEIMDAKVVINTNGSLLVKETIKAKKYEVDDAEKESASIGENSIKAGETEVVIESTTVTESSKIFLTNTKETDLPLAVVEKIRRKSFKVKIKEKSEEDISFNWWIVN